MTRRPDHGCRVCYQIKPLPSRRMPDGYTTMVCDDCAPPEQPAPVPSGRRALSHRSLVDRAMGVGKSAVRGTRR